MTALHPRRAEAAWRIFSIMMTIAIPGAMTTANDDGCEEFVQGGPLIRCARLERVLYSSIWKQLLLGYFESISA